MLNDSYIPFLTVAPIGEVGPLLKDSFNGWTLNALYHAKMHTGPRAWPILVQAHLAHTAGQQGETSAPCC